MAAKRFVFVLLKGRQIYTRRPYKGPGSTAYHSQWFRRHVRWTRNHKVEDKESLGSPVIAVAHRAMGRRIDPSWGEPIELFFVPASAPRLV